MSETHGYGPMDLASQGFWEVGSGFEEVEIGVAPPDRPLALLEQLGPSPFERGGFPVIGFLATTYDKVSRFSLEGPGGRRA